MSWLGILNFTLLQWFFVRLGRMVLDGETIGYSLMLPVLPLTGWWSDYVHLGKIHHLAIWVDKSKVP